jgi:hypothetical protein
MRLVPLLALAACVTPRPAEDPSDWYDPGSELDVVEPIAFTDQPYDFTGQTPIADLPLPDAFQTWFDADDAPSPECRDWGTTDELPAQIEGVATILPRFYTKSDGCGGSAEKYYGSFFVQDASGGMFVLGDTKVAHFDAGMKVKLKVRATRESFGQYMIASYDLVSVDYDPVPIYYQEVTTELGPAQVSLVVRAEGVVATEATTFGEIYFDSDDGVRYKFTLDQELSKRGVTFPVGTRVQVTGPVLYSFSEYQIVVMRAGQVTVL